VIAPSPDKSDAIFQSRGLVNFSKPMSKGARKAAIMRMALDSDSDY
jgi:DNA-binding phage protein